VSQSLSFGPEGNVSVQVGYFLHSDLRSETSCVICGFDVVGCDTIGLLGSVNTTVSEKHAVSIFSPEIFVVEQDVALVLVAYI
jgi:hypothetical protein